MSEVLKRSYSDYYSMILIMIKFLPWVLVPYEYFWSLSLENHEVLYFCVSEEKTNLLLKREGKRLLIDMLINNIFSKLILSLNFKTSGLMAL